jgi:hypothetical protein
MFAQSNGNHLPNNTASHPRRPQSSPTLLSASPTLQYGLLLLLLLFCCYHIFFTLVNIDFSFVMDEQICLVLLIYNFLQLLRNSYLSKLLQCILCGTELAFRYIIKNMCIIPSTPAPVLIQNWFCNVGGSVGSHMKSTAAHLIQQLKAFKL